MFLQARYSAPDFGIFIQFVPAGVRIPDGTSRGEFWSHAFEILVNLESSHAAFPRYMVIQDNSYIVWNKSETAC